MDIYEPFRKFAIKVSQAVGSPKAFILAILIITIWAGSGAFFNFSDTWQLVINTGTTIVTFLIVFLIQNTQNRDSKALHIKLDELLRGVKGARNEMVDIEDLPDEEIEALHQQFKKLHIKYKKELLKRGKNVAIASKKQVDIER
jgi:low affinity Fe/Cu permease